MKDYFGHEENVRALKEGLPAVSLFLGPKSVGKWELAEWLRAYFKVLSADVLRIKRLTQDNARFVAQFASVAPHGEFKLVIIRLEKATPNALNTLLKTLEEATTTRFILISTAHTLPTIESRSAIFEFGLLSERDVADILVGARNFDPDTAEDRAKKSQGRVESALKHYSRQDDKLLVLRALEAIASKDAKTLDSLAVRWQEEHTQLLIAWCYESLTSRWIQFMEDECSIRGTAIPLRILIAVREELRPRLVVRAALASVLQ